MILELLPSDAFIVTRKDLEELIGDHSISLQKEITKLVDLNELIMVSKDTWMIASKAKFFAKNFEDKLLEYHSSNKFNSGMRFELVAKLYDICIECVDKILCVFARYININIYDGVVTSQTFKPELTGDVLSMYQVIVRSVQEEPKLWLALGEVKSQCAVSSKEAETVVRILVNQKLIVVLDNKYLVSIAEISRLSSLLDSAFNNFDVLDIASWRKICGLSRNHAVAVLEYFDSQNITLRMESGRKKYNLNKH